MTPARFIEKRKQDWHRLEELIRFLENRAERSIPAARYRAFADLYRSVATDLSLSEAYLLPLDTKEYLQGLVSRSHSLLYSFSQPRSRLQSALRYVTHEIPRSVFLDTYVWICQTLFWASLLFSASLALHTEDFSRTILGETMMEQVEQMHTKKKEHSIGQMAFASAGYVFNNGSINLQVFALGSLAGIGALLGLLFNGIFLGNMIGFLLTGPASSNTLCWIAGHAVFELYAIGLSAGAGLRIGYALVDARGRSRLRSLREEAVNAIPVILSALVLTVVAGFIEAWIGPMQCSSVWASATLLKASIFVFSILFVIFYFYVLGYLRFKEGSA